MQRKVGSRWRAIGTLTTDSNGIFQKRLARPWRSGYLRAKVGRSPSIPFSLTPVADRHFNAFGRLPTRAGQCG